MGYLNLPAFAEPFGKFAPATCSASSLRTNNRGQTQHGRRQPVLLVIGLHQQLLHPFGGGIYVLGPAGMIFVHRHVIRSIKLCSWVPLVSGNAAGQDESLNPCLACPLQDVEAAVDIHPNHLLWIASITGQGSEVEDMDE